MNELLRQHVTRVGFNLTLTKHQIAEFVYLDAQLSDTRSLGERVGDGQMLDNTIGRHILTNGTASRRSLMSRGLVAHHPSGPRAISDRGEDLMNSTTRDNWSFTAAGRAVIVLLRESGLWQEVAAEVPWVKPPTPADTYTAEEEVVRLRDKLDEAERRLREARDEASQERSGRRRAEIATQRAEVRYQRLQDRVRDVMAMVEPDASGAAA